jgi:hypothetical protein
MNLLHRKQVHKTERTGTAIPTGIKQTQILLCERRLAFRFMRCVWHKRSGPQPALGSQKIGVGQLELENQGRTQVSVG